MTKLEPQACPAIILQSELSATLHFVLFVCWYSTAAISIANLFKQNGSHIPSTMFFTTKDKCDSIIEYSYKLGLKWEFKIQPSPKEISNQKHLLQCLLAAHLLLTCLFLHACRYIYCYHQTRTKSSHSSLTQNKSTSNFLGNFTSIPELFIQSILMRSSSH